MTEKINGQTLRPPDTVATRRAEAGKRAEASADSSAQSAPAPSSGDTVNITRSAVLLGRLEEVVAGTPVVDSERVAALKDALSSGSFEVDDQRVADKLLRFERDLLA